MNNRIKNLILLGRSVFAVAIMAFGLLCFAYSDFVSGLEPLPSWVGGRLFLAYSTGIIFVMAGAGLTVSKTAQLAAIILGTVFHLWVLLLHLPKLIAEPRNGSVWTVLFETLALGGAAWVLAKVLSSEQSAQQAPSHILKEMSLFGRLCFGISLPVFGVLHFIYYGYVASVIPGWIPYPLFWAYFTGVAMIAAGISIIFNIKARLAAVLVGAMFGLWVLILHLPRVLVHLNIKEEWTSLFIALAMCGGALIIAGSLILDGSEQEAEAESKFIS